MHRILGLLAAGLLVSAGLANAPATAAEGDATPAPIVGSCYDLTAQEADGASLPRAAVDCAVAHTSEIVAVGALPAGLTWSSPEDDLMNAVVPVCGRALDRVSGGNPLRQVQSQYDVVWFYPTTAEQETGARWFSCHAVARNAHGLGLLPHPLPKLGKRTSDAVATCLTGTLAYTTCADKHAWRSSHAFYAVGKPTKRNLDAAANKTCPRRVTSRKWLHHGIDVAGKRFIVVCYSKSRR